MLKAYFDFSSVSYLLFRLSGCTTTLAGTTILGLMTLTTAISVTLALTAAVAFSLAFSAAGSGTFSVGSAVVAFPISVFIFEIFTLGAAAFGFVIITNAILVCVDEFTRCRSGLFRVRFGSAGN